MRRTDDLEGELSGWVDDFLSVAAIVAGEALIVLLIAVATARFFDALVAVRGRPAPFLCRQVPRLRQL